MQALELGGGGVQNPNPNQNQMALELESLSVNDLLNFIIYDNTTLTAPAPSSIFFPNDSSPDQFNSLPPNPPEFTFTGRGAGSDNSGSTMQQRSIRINLTEPEASAQGRKKRRRRPKVLKNKEEAETQRMTHIAVERNRRKQMNDHLAVLRSLMPESYIQRGDQASIVGGAIEYIKGLEHLLQTLEAQKLLSLQGGAAATASSFLSAAAPFAQFFCYPQYTWSELVSNNKCTSKSKQQGGSSTVADIEVTLIETHANVRILSKKSFTQLSKLVSALHTLFLSILHLNVTTVDPLVLYSISAKVEEGCQLTSADDIAGAVHHVLRIIEEEASLC